MTNLPDAFQEARNRISPSLIEEYFSVNGAYWSRGEYFTLCPFRGDKTIGSFHISESGEWFDHAIGEGGDFINLVARAKNISDLEAAKLIAGNLYEPQKRNERETTSANDKKRKTKNKERIAPQYPIPESETSKASDYFGGSFFTNQWGEHITTFAIRNIDSDILYFIARYEKKRKPTEDEPNPKNDKEVIPFYLGIDGKYYSGLPWEDKIPMYGVNKIKHGSRVVIVEGEKKAVQAGESDFVFVSPVGGGAKFQYADLEPLKLASEVIFWPDNDEPGMKAVLSIFEKTPCKKKSIIKITDRPEKWDVCDLLEQGEDPDFFINNTEKFQPTEDDFLKYKIHKPAKSEPPPPTDEPPSYDPLKPIQNSYFHFLGWDDEYHYFMILKTRVIMTIGKQSFTSSKCLSIAPLMFWESIQCTTDKGGFKILASQDFLQENSVKAGRFSMDIVRGAGVWIDGKHKVVNTGSELYIDGIKTKYEKFDSRYVYVTSEKDFGKIEGEMASSTDGKKLFKLFESQKWVNPQSLYGAMGWSLISNFGGCLNWRPHIYITGKIGSGKSWLLDNVVKPLVGDYAHYGSGSDTEAGIRRSIMQEPRPVVLDEMKIKSKKDESNIGNIMNLIRNSSSDASAKITMASPDGGTINFNVRSPFCLSSDQIPYETEDLASRILICELETPHHNNRKFHEEEKSSDSRKFIDVLSDPDIFRTRIFQKLEDILNDIYWLQNDKWGLKGVPYFDTNRIRANWAPLLAVIYNVLNDTPMTKGNLDMATQWVVTTCGNWSDDSLVMTGDEENIINVILEHTVRIEMEERSVAEMLLDLDGYEHKKYLGRMGIKVNAKNQLCIATNSQKIKEILKNKSYSENYDSQLKRNELCINGRDKTVNVRFNEIGNRMSRLFDFEKFKKKYLDEAEDGGES